MSDERLIYDKIMDETKQAHSTRIELYKKFKVSLIELMKQIEMTI